MRRWRGGCGSGRRGSWRGGCRAATDVRAFWSTPGWFEKKITASDGWAKAILASDLTKSNLTQKLGSSALTLLLSRVRAATAYFCF